MARPMLHTEGAVFDELPGGVAHFELNCTSAKAPHGHHQATRPVKGGAHAYVGSSIVELRLECCCSFIIGTSGKTSR